MHWLGGTTKVHIPQILHYCYPHIFCIKEELWLSISQFNRPQGENTSYAIWESFYRKIPIGHHSQVWHLLESQTTFSPSFQNSQALPGLEYFCIWRETVQFSSSRVITGLLGRTFTSSLSLLPLKLSSFDPRGICGWFSLYSPSV